MYRIMEKKEPIYATIMRELLSNIERGEWPIGHKVPSEEELQKQYEASRGTVRRALYELESAGYITRMSGKGTFVARVMPKLEKALGEISSFTEQLSQAGFEPATRVLSAKIIQTSEAKGTKVEEGFGIPGDAEVVYIKRLREGGGAPFAIQSVYLLPGLCPNVLEEDLSHLFRLYEEKYGRRMMRADEVIRVSGASTEEAKLLQVDPGTPVIIRDRISYDQDDEVFEILHSVDRGDRFEYRYMILNDATQVPGAPQGVAAPGSSF